MEKTICLYNDCITPNKRYSRVVLKSTFISDAYSQYLTFNIIIRSNNLIPNKKYSSQQQENYDLIKSLHKKGLGYRKIANHLNATNIKTSRGNPWKNSNVYSVLKKYQEREKRIELRKRYYEPTIGKMKLEWIKSD